MLYTITVDGKKHTIRNKIFKYEAAYIAQGVNVGGALAVGAVRMFIELHSASSMKQIEWEDAFRICRWIARGVNIDRFPDKVDTDYYR